MKPLGRVRELWRYPVKSMAGERLPSCVVGPLGVPGDRLWAVRDEAAGEIRGAKKLPRLLECRARTVAEGRGGVEVEFPSGTRLRADEAHASAELSRFLDRRVSLCALRPAEDLEFYRRGLPDNPDMLEELREMFGREEDEPLPDLSVFPPEIMEFTSPLGTFFDAFPLHLVTTASLEELARRGPGPDYDARRFRPNFLVETGDEAGTGLVEAAWPGRELRVGGARIRVQIPTVRCSMVAQPQAGLAKEPAVLRTVVREADQNLGVYATVVEPGEVREGDPVALLD